MVRSGIALLEAVRMRGDHIFGRTAKTLKKGSNEQIPRGRLIFRRALLYKEWDKLVYLP